MMIVVDVAISCVFDYNLNIPLCLHVWKWTSSVDALILPARRLVLRLLCRFCVCISVALCVRTYHVHNNYVTYIVAMRPYFSRLQQFRRLLCVAAMSTLPQLQLRGGYREAEAT